MTRFLTVAVVGVVLLGGTPDRACAQSGIALKGGVTFGDVSNKGVLPGNLDGRTGFAGGVAFGGTTGLLGLGIEGLYAQRGLSSSGTSSVGDRRLDYVDVPVLVRVTLPTPGIRPFGYLGPQVSFELRCRTGSTDCPTLEPSGEERKKTTFSGVIGAGVILGGSTGLSVEGRYLYGLTDLKLGTVTSRESYKSRSFLILAGVQF